MLKQSKYSFLLLGLIFFSLSVYAQKDKFSLVWDFNKFKTLTYTFHQSMQTDNIFFDWNFLQADGKLLIRVINTDTAEVYFSDMTFAQMQIDSLGDTIPKEVTRNSCEQLLFRISKSGHMVGNDPTNAQTALLMVFPMINKQFVDGDSTDIPMFVPFNFFGRVINANGYNHLRFFSKRKGVKFIQSDFDLVNRGTNDKVPDALCYVRGNCKWAYNAKRKYFNSTIVNLQMLMGKKSRDDQNEDVGIKTITTLKLELSKVRR